MGEGQHGQGVGLRGWEERGRGEPSDLHLAMVVGLAEYVGGRRGLGEAGPDLAGLPGDGVDGDAGDTWL